MVTKRKAILLLLILLLLMTAAAGLLAQTSASHDLSWHLISAGGESASANFRVNGSLGQDMTSPPLSDSAGFIVSSGYWFTALTDGTAVFLPAIVR
jgi:hypothetical protein